jgi:hypothetical protein
MLAGWSADVQNESCGAASVADRLAELVVASGNHPAIGVAENQLALDAE